MTDQLPYLLRLCDDNSPRVRERVLNALREISDVEGEIARRGLELSASQQEALRSLFVSQREDGVRLVNLAEAFTSSPSGEFSARESDGPSADGPRPQWLDWLELDNDWEKLEAALDAVARWLDYDFGNILPVSAAEETLWPDAVPPSVSDVLDELAREYEATGLPRDAGELAEWLFRDRKLSGVPSGDFYNPLNSHLVHVVQRGRGLPISLTAIFMLVAHRLDLEVYGCNFPGHFLASARIGGVDIYFDPYDGGRELTQLEAQAIRKAAPDATARSARAEEIVARVLRNLATAYEYSGDRSKAHFMLQLLEELVTAG